jgi:hypothetical protein
MKLIAWDTSQDPVSKEKRNYHRAQWLNLCYTPVFRMPGRRITFVQEFETSLGNIAKLLLEK